MEEKFAKQTLKNSPIRDCISNFKSIDTTLDGALVVRGVTLKHDIDVFFIFKDYDFYVSFTHFDRIPINNHKNETAIINLLDSFFKAVSAPDAIMLLLEYFYKNYATFIDFESDFMMAKKKSHLYNHISELISKLHGYHMSKEHDRMFKMLLEQFSGIKKESFIKT